jgi:pantoate kinase
MEEGSATAFSPAGISSFFEICDRNPDGSKIEDVSQIGARGGGFGLERGVTTVVRAEPSENTRIRSFINGETVEAKTSQTSAYELLKKLDDKFNVEIDHRVDVPIGSGFGTSAAGAFSCGLALAEALEIPVTYNEIGVIAHNADVVCSTGLGTVEGLAVGGLVLVIEPGAPGIGVTDQIPISPDLRIVAGSFRPIKKETVLLSEERRTIINRLGQKTMKNILMKPNVENFMKCCKDFALEIGLMSKKVLDLIEDAEKEGAIGATQNMIGEAVHAAVYEKDLDSVVRVFKRRVPERSIVVSKIDFQGARILP